MSKSCFLGLDVSSSNIGISLFERIDGNLKLKNTFNIELNGNLEIYQRFDEFEKYVNSINFDFCIMEARLKNFAPGFSNKNALLAVAAANEICSFICYKTNKKLFKFHPISYRSILNVPRKLDDIKSYMINYMIEHEIFKDYLLENKFLLNQIFKTKIISKGKNKGKEVFLPGSSDIADSFAIGIGGEKLIYKKGYNINENQ